MLNYDYFLIKGYAAPFGYVHKSFVQAMQWPEYWDVDHEERFLTLGSTSANILLSEERTKDMNKTLTYGIDSGSVKGLDGWCGDDFIVYDPDGNRVLKIDGVGADLFGIVNHSVNTLCLAGSRRAMARRGIGSQDRPWPCGTQERWIVSLKVV